MTAGSARLVGTSAERIFAAANELLDDPAAYELMAKRPNPFGDGHAAERIVGSLIERHAVVSDGA